jgi:hypothetical protein
MAILAKRFVEASLPRHPAFPPCSARFLKRAPTHRAASLQGAILRSLGGSDLQVRHNAAFSIICRGRASARLASNASALRFLSSICSSEFTSPSSAFDFPPRCHPEPNPTCPQRSRGTRPVFWTPVQSNRTPNRRYANDLNRNQSITDANSWFTPRACRSGIDVAHYSGQIDNQIHARLLEKLKALAAARTHSSHHPQRAWSACPQSSALPARTASLRFRSSLR